MSELIEKYAEDLAEFGRIMKAKRAEEGITLDKVSADVGIGKAYLSRIERGERLSPSFIIVYELAKYYDINLNEIILEPILEVKERA